MAMLKELLDQSADRLAAAGVYSPREDAEKIAAKIFGIPRDAIKEQGARLISGAEIQQFESALSRRENREPIARIFNGTEFCGLNIGLVDGVFEPLPESESLVEHAVEYLKPLPGPLRVLDLGCGAGGLLLGVLSQVPNATGLGIDINAKAIQQAQKNAANNGLESRAKFQTGDWVEGIEEQFDVIISNPPFIPKGLIRKLMPEVRVYDPLPSLDGGRDGMRFYRRLAHDFPKLAKPGGTGFFQMSYTVCELALSLLNKAGYGSAAVLRNHYGMPVGISLSTHDISQSAISQFNRWRFGL